MTVNTGQAKKPPLMSSDCSDTFLGMLKPHRLWDQLLIELRESGTGVQDSSEESLLNFARTPFHLERVMAFGTAVCLDSFLYVLTILPVLFVLAIIRPRYRDRGDVVKGLIFIITLAAMLRLNTSRVYHGIRGQAGVTLFAMFSIFEVTDKVCCAIGMDIVECLVALSTPAGPGSPFRAVIYALLALAYVAAHAFVLLWQLVTLNVAVNSYSNALLSLMLTSQFGELKGAIFKRFDADQLFQLTCLDITQRFQLVLMLAAIVVRNLVEPSAAASSGGPWAAVGPAFMVTVSVVAVDWLKHAYIVNFNSLRPAPMYRRFLHLLISDFHDHQRKFSSHHLMMKSLGLPVLPLAVVCVRIFAKCSAARPLPVVMLWLGLLLCKLVLGVALRTYPQQLKPELDHTAKYRKPL